MTDPDDAHVTYTVKELLSQIKKDQTEGFTRLETSLGAKADKADIVRLEKTLESHGRELERHGTQIGELQGFQRDIEEGKRKRFKLGAGAWRVIWGALGLAATSFATYAGIHGL